MHKLDLSSHHLKLEYPCTWIYKIIGPDEGVLRAAVAALLVDRNHVLSVSNTSTTGKYICLNLEMEVVDEEDRQNVYEVLRNDPTTTIIL